jgi:hypothetical protein
MPNVLCERCEIHMCRVVCSHCTKHVCDRCRQTIQRQYVCNACHLRRMPSIVRSVVQVKRDRRGTIEFTPWRLQVDALLEQMYVAAGSPFGLRPISASITEYAMSDRSTGTQVRDRYARLGKHYTCHRLILSPTPQGFSVTRVEVPMRLSEEQKESIAAGAMHPSRLGRWLDRGWEDDWDDYFS